MAVYFVDDAYASDRIVIVVRCDTVTAVEVCRMSHYMRVRVRTKISYLNRVPVDGDGA